MAYYETARLRNQINEAVKRQQLEEDFRLLFGPPTPNPPTVGYGNVELKINADSFTNPKVTSQVMANPPAKKYRASLLVESNDLDRGSLTTQRLLSVDLTADSFTDLVAQAHGHLELAKDN